MTRELPETVTTPEDTKGKALKSATPVVDGLDVSNLTEEYLGMLEAGGVSCWHRSMGDFKSFAEAYEFVDRNSSRIGVVRSAGEIRQLHGQGRLSLLFGWQSSNPVSTGRGDENDWWGTPPQTTLRAYYELGLRICGIAYQVANVFGGGAIDGHMGLSRAGRALVGEIHRLGMVLDVGGHTGDQTSFDAIELSEGMPVICSHGNARALADSSRNVSDRLAEAIASTGGVVGVVAINDFVMRGRSMAYLAETPMGTVDDMLNHAEHYRKLVGIDHIGLGPDFTWGQSNQRDRAIFGPAAMDAGPRRFVKGFENISELPNVVKALESREWPGEDIEKFLGSNWLRVYEKVWGS